jgi:hypothetical protein
MKAGFKTSEFWLTIVLIGIAAAAFFAKRIDWQAATTFIGLALSVGSYAVSRGLSKDPTRTLPPGSTIIPLVLGLVLMTGCAGWQVKAQKSFVGAETAMKGLSAFAEAYFRDECKSKAEQCLAVADKACKPLDECQVKRRQANQTIIGIHMAIYAGLGVCSLGDEKGTAAIVDKTLTDVKNVQAIIGGMK